MSKFDSYNELLEYIETLPPAASSQMLSIDVPIYNHRCSQEAHSFMEKMKLTQSLKTCKKSKFSFSEINKKVDNILNKLPGNHYDICYYFYNLFPFIKILIFVYLKTLFCFKKLKRNLFSLALMWFYYMKFRS